MTIKFRKKSQGEWIVLFVLLMPFLFFVFMNILGFPALVKYLVDVGWLILFILLLRKGNKRYSVPIRKLIVLVCSFLLLSMIVYVVRYQSVWYYLWGLRNNFRFFVFFFACVSFVQEKSVWNYLKVFDVVFWINLPIVCYQYFVKGYARDYLGGVFGTEVGCNGYLNIFLVIVVTKSLICYLHKVETFPKFLVIFVFSVLIAVVSELKVFFAEIILIFALAMLLTQRTNRKVSIILLITVGIAVGVQIMERLFPDFSGWFAFDRIVEILTDERGYNGKGSVNRLTAIPIVMKRFLPSLFDKLFGLGLGNCDYAAYRFLQTPFYQTYSALRYQWFSSAMLVLETGIVGMAMYVLFFVEVYIAASKLEKAEVADPKLCQMAKIMVVFSFVMMIYNSSLRTEAAYMLYFVLALPFARNVSQVKNRVLKEP